MWKNLFSQINIKAENVHIPDSLASDVPASCTAYEQAIADAGGIDLQVLGIGANGHIGFNEPTSSFGSRTRIKTMSQQTVQGNACFFGGDEAQVPRHCITMGRGTIMDVRRIVLLAFGEDKAEAIAAMQTCGAGFPACTGQTGMSAPHLSNRNHFSYSLILFALARIFHKAPESGASGEGTTWTGNGLVASPAYSVRCGKGISTPSSSNLRFTSMSRLLRRAM